MKMQKWSQLKNNVLGNREALAGVRMKAQIIVEMLRQEMRLMAEWGAAAEIFVRTVKHAAQRCEYMMMLW